MTSTTPNPLPGVFFISIVEGSFGCDEQYIGISKNPDVGTAIATCRPGGLIQRNKRLLIIALVGEHVRIVPHHICRTIRQCFVHKQYRGSQSRVARFVGCQ